MSAFDKATAVHGAAGEYSVDLDPQWTVGGRPNGGYLLAALARAAVAEAGGPTHPHALSASVVYVTPPTPSLATITARALRLGRAASQVSATLRQDGQVRAEALFTLGALDASTAPLFDASPPVDVAPPELCRLSLVEQPRTGLRIEMLGQVEQRIDRAGLKDPAHAGDLRGWLSFADGSPFDPISLLFAVDSFPPATIAMGSIGWVPTLELTAYIRAVPAPGRLRVRQRARLLAGGVVDQVCDVWDSTDRLVAQATQLAAVRLPAP